MNDLPPGGGDRRRHVGWMENPDEHVTDPATRADKPAKRMRADGVIVSLLSLPAVSPFGMLVLFQFMGISVGPWRAPIDQWPQLGFPARIGASRLKPQMVQ